MSAEPGEVRSWSLSVGWFELSDGSMLHICWLVIKPVAVLS